MFPYRRSKIRLNFGALWCSMLSSGGICETLAPHDACQGPSGEVGTPLPPLLSRALTLLPKVRSCKPRGGQQAGGGQKAHLTRLMTPKGMCKTRCTAM